MPLGSGTSVGSVALCGVEPGARRLGNRGEKRGCGPVQPPLRKREWERNFRFGAMAESLECECLAAVSCGRRDGIQAGGDSSVHHTGRPLGSAEFVQALEGSMKRRLAPQKGGRPPKSCLDARQSELAFEPE